MSISICSGKDQDEAHSAEEQSHEEGRHDIVVKVTDLRVYCSGQCVLGNSI